MLKKQRLCTLYCCVQKIGIESPFDLKTGIGVYSMNKTGPGVRRKMFFITANVASGIIRCSAAPVRLLFKPLFKRKNRLYLRTLFDRARYVNSQIK